MNNCIKCGVEIKEPQVFCESCLAEMEKYPVKPNVTVSIPSRPADSPKKKTRRQRYVNPEDQIRLLRFRNRMLATMLITMFLAFAAVSALLLHIVNSQDDTYAPGQNYGTMSTADEN